MAKSSTKVPRGLHIFHIIVCLATMGFIFPDALMENEVRTDHSDLTKRKVK